MLIDELYERAHGTPSDIWEHLELLARLSSLCSHVTEFGARLGTSTAALIFGRPGAVVSYDIHPLPAADTLASAAAEAGVQFRFCQADILTIRIEPTDLLLIDTLHTFEQLTAELRLHAAQVRRFIAMHDTTTFGDRGGGEVGDTEARTKVGLWPAIAAFLRTHEEWHLLFYFTNNNGLTVLERSQPPLSAGMSAQALGYEKAKNDRLPDAPTEREIVDLFHQVYYNAAELTWKRTFWLGVPAQKCPLDLWIYQEILFETRPDVVIETGTLWGGSALFFASIFDLMGAGRVITIDVQPQLGRLDHKRITYLTGSSTSAEISAEVRRRIEPHEKAMVVLDSDHSAAHVLREMQTYKSYVTPGAYLVVEDTNVNGNPVLPGFGAGPREAVEEFLKHEIGFVQDRTREKFRLTFSAGGYLRRRG